MRIASILVAAALATHCSNAVMFYEVDRVSITAEGKPDASQPVSMNVGLKERVVLVAPTGDSPVRWGEEGGTKDRYSATPPAGATQSKLRAGEAVSVISSFEFRLTEDPDVTVWFDDNIDIRSVFITGGAARNLTQQEAKSAAGAVALAKLSDTELAILNLYFGDLESLGRKDLVVRLNKLTSVAPSSYEVDQYGSGGNATAPAPWIRRTQVRGDALKVTDFGGLCSYYAELRATAMRLAACLPADGGTACTGSIQEPDGTITPITPQVATDRKLSAVRDRALELQEEIERQVNKDPAVAELVEFMRSRLGS